MANFLRWLIRFYQVVISPLLAPRCRYIPTCSQYALDAVHEYGAYQGSWLAFRRICRCHPWGGSGYDPVPRKNLYISFSILYVQTPFFGVPLSKQFIQHHFSLFRTIHYAKVG